MTQPENEFLEAMWKKAARKEENLKLAEELSRLPKEEGMSTFLWDIFFGIGIRQLYAYMADILFLSFSLAVFLLFMGSNLLVLGCLMA